MLCSYCGKRPKRYSDGLCRACYEYRRANGHLVRVNRGEYGEGFYRRGYKILTGGKAEHVAVCEAALGKPLPKGAVVHHVNGVKNDNRNSNLVVCPNQSYHALIEHRTKLWELRNAPSGN